MKLLKKIFKGLLGFILIPCIYLIISLILSHISVNKKQPSKTNKTIYLNTNGVHLDIVIPKAYLKNSFLKGINHNDNESYLAFGWGDENFYLNTPEWKDLTFKNAFSALFLNSSSLIHIVRYKTKRASWVPVPITDQQLDELIKYLSDSFSINAENAKIQLNNKGYSFRDDFYKANGSYSIFKTCNSWVNKGFKESNLKASVWTPFDFGLLNKYQ